LHCPPPARSKKNNAKNSLSSAQSLPSLDNIDSHQISLLLDTQIEALSNPWKGSITFNCFIFSGDENEIPLLLSGRVLLQTLIFATTLVDSAIQRGVCILIQKLSPLPDKMCISPMMIMNLMSGYGQN
jgi:hypothetical protein